ncbi:MAG TPA: transporter [Bryobacteraceae bacterium]|jgi:hypothetical protein
MCKGRLFRWLALALLYTPHPLCAQFTDPRNYNNAPVDVNQLELTYAYTHANTSIDTSLVIAGASLNLNAGVIDYTRYLSLFKRLAWVEAAVPLGGANGSVTGTGIERSVTSTGDSNYEFAALLKGGPALSVAQFGNYKPITTLGVSFAITAPTGQYTANKILNLGADRWSFKPEIGISHPFGPDQRWEFDAYANVYFYTDNTAYRGAEILRQESLPGLEGHISYSLTSNLWVSLDSRYSFRGNTFVDGVNQNDAQRNFGLGTELNVAFGSQTSLVFELARALVHENGPAYTGIALKYIYTWGKGYK